MESEDRISTNSKQTTTSFNSKKVEKIKDKYLKKSNTKKYSKTVINDFLNLMNKGPISSDLSQGLMKQQKQDVKNLDYSVAQLGFILTVIPKGKKTAHKDIPVKIKGTEFMTRTGGCFMSKKIRFRIDLKGDMVIESRTGLGNSSDVLFPWLESKFRSKFRFFLEDEQGKMNYFIYSNDLNDMLMLKDYLILKKFDKGAKNVDTAKVILAQILKSKVAMSELIYEKMVDYSNEVAFISDIRSVKETERLENYSIDTFRYEKSYVSNKEAKSMVMSSINGFNLGVSSGIYTSNLSMSTSKEEASNMYLNSLKPSPIKLSSGSFKGSKIKKNMDLSVIVEQPIVKVYVDSFILHEELSWLNPKLIFHLLELTTTVNSIENVRHKPLSLTFSDNLTVYDEEKNLIFLHSTRELQFSDRISSKNENTLEVTICAMNTNGESKAIHSLHIPFSSIILVLKIGCCLSIPIKILDKPCVLNLRASSNLEGTRNVGRESEYYKKIKKVIIQKSLDMTNTFSTYNTEALLDEFLNETVKKKEHEKIPKMYFVALPPSLMLNLWLIIAKKCKGILEQAKLSASSIVEKRKEEVQKSLGDQFKSSIMRSLYEIKRKNPKKKLKLKSNNIFEILIKNMENLSKLDVDLYEESFGLLGTLTDQYFISKANRKLLIEYFLLHIMGDYFNMNHVPKKNITHLLFSKNLRSVSRDAIVIKYYIENHCQNLSKWLKENNENLTVFLVEKILSTNLELLKEPNSQYYVNYLFLLSLKHKYSRDQNFGWQLNIFFTLRLLQKIDQVCKEENWLRDSRFGIAECKNSIRDIAKSPEFVTEIFNSYCEIYEENEDSGFFNIVKNAVTGEESIEKKAIKKIQEDGDIEKGIKGNIDINISIYEILRTRLSLHSLISLIKPEKIGNKRRIHFMLHKIYNKSSEIDQFTASFQINNQPQIYLNGDYAWGECDEGYPPSLKVTLLKEGKEVFFEDNFMVEAMAKIQMKRFKVNVIHPVIIGLTHVKNRARKIYVSCSILIQENNDKIYPRQFGSYTSSFHSGINHGYNRDTVLLGSFKYQSSDVLQKVEKKISDELEDIDLNFTHQMFSQLYETESTRREFLETSIMRAKNNINLSTLNKCSQNGYLNSFELMIKLGLLSKQFKKFEEYLFRFFSVGQNVIEYNDLVFSFFHLMNIINLRMTKNEICSFIQEHTKRPIKFKMKSFVVLLNCSRLKAETRIDLTKEINSLLYFYSNKYDCNLMMFSVENKAILLKDILDRYGASNKLGEDNAVLVEYEYNRINLKDTWEFNQDFEFKEFLKPENRKTIADDDLDVKYMMRNNRFCLNLNPVFGEHINEKLLKRLMNETQIMEYVKYVTESLKI